MLKQSQRGRSGQIYWNQVRDLKPDFLSPQWSEMKKLSAYHKEDFLITPDLDPSVIFEGVMTILNMGAFFWDTLNHPEMH